MNFGIIGSLVGADGLALPRGADCVFGGGAGAETENETDCNPFGRNLRSKSVFDSTVTVLSNSISPLLATKDSRGGWGCSNNSHERPRQCSPESPESP